MKCAKGEIVRKAYTTNAGIRVKAGCVPDRGKPGKGPKILPAPKEHGFLTKYGYRLELSSFERQMALQHAISKEGEAKVMQHLNLIRNITATGTKNKSKLTSDVNFLKKANVKSKSRSRSRSRSKSKSKSRK